MASALLNLFVKTISGERKEIKSLVEGKTTLIYVLRRFGCMFCRLDSVNLSTLKPALDAKNIKMIGICHDEDQGNYNEFLEGSYFDGDIFLDPERNVYKTLGYGSDGTIGGLLDIVKKDGRNKKAECDKRNISGNFRGDGLQRGGVIILNEKGEEIYRFEQMKSGDSPRLEEIINLLKLDKSLIRDADKWEEWSKKK